jgi:hypothetical protein
MMESTLVRNTCSTLSNKFEKQCISLALIIRIHQDARSSEGQISLKLTYSHNTVKGNSEIIERNVLITCERHKSKQYIGQTPS